MKRTVLLTYILSLFSLTAFSQSNQFWAASGADVNAITQAKAVARLSFPKQFKLFNLAQPALRQQLFTVVGNSGKHSTVISLPNADGSIEQYEVFEASNFEPALQQKFPEIRAFSGRGITDKYATLKLSISPQGVHAMIFRTEKQTEFIEPFSQDRTVYAVFKSQREKGKLPWACTTQDNAFDAGIKKQLPQTNFTASSAGELKVMRLAQSVTAEYSNYFGATAPAQVGLVLAAVNTTLTRSNGCYEKDLAIHLNLILATVNVFYYDPNTDPYSPGAIGAGGAWNGELQSTLTAVIGEANYDIGHLFGDSGGGGNAGCIGCVCVNGLKGSGYTSPADNIPEGDNFDIDYVVHEVGHQLGGNHTFSHGLEGTGRNKEVGSGITIMGYAGITNFDAAPHSIDIFHETTIEQIQANMATKVCPVTTNITANNAIPVITALPNYTIPMSTPFALTGAATDANNDPLTYCWEQTDNSTVSGANSVAAIAKPSGPNWLSFPPTASPTRLFPRLSTILAGLNVTPTLGGDPACDVEALSSIARTLNFRLTVRDNHPYSAAPPIAVAQTAFANTTVTVTNTAGPFQVTSPNTNVGWCTGTTQTITWDVNGTDAGVINCANVRITLSTDGGQTFPIVLFASTPNDGTETIAVPNNLTSTARIKIEAIGNIFFDICNTDFKIVSSAAITMTTQPVAAAACHNGQVSYTVSTTGSSLDYQWQESTDGGATWTNITNGGAYSGADTAVLNINPVTIGMNNYRYRCTITNACNPVTTSDAVLLSINPATNITTQVVNAAACLGGSTTFTVGATGTGTLTYQWQESSTGGASWTVLANGGVYSGVTTTVLTLTGVTAGMNNYRYRCMVTSPLCTPAASTAAGVLTIGNAVVINTQPSNAIACEFGAVNYTVAATNANGYQWQESTDGGATWISLSNNSTYSNVTTATLTVSGITASMNNNRYRCIASGICPGISSGGALLTVNTAPFINTQPPAAVAVCNGQGTSVSVAASGTALTYQWQLSTDGGVTYTNLTNAGVYNNVTTAAMSITSTTAAMNNYKYRCLLSGTCTPAVNSIVTTLSVNTPVALVASPVNYTICENSNASFTVSVTGTAPTYQWQVSTNGGAAFTNITNGSVYSGTTQAILGLSNVSAAYNTYQYRCIVSGAAPCGNLTSGVAALSVNSAPAAFTVTGGGAYCAGGIGVPIRLSGSASGIRYQLQLNGVNTGAAVAGTGTVLNFGNITAAGVYTVIAYNATTGCIAPMPGSATVAIYPQPTVTLTAAPYTKVFPGLSTTLTAVASSGTPAYSYTWFKNSLPVTNSGSTYPVNVSNMGDYRVIATDANGCTALSSVVTISDSANDKLFIYPNPNQGQFNVVYYNPGNTPVDRTLAIFSSKGERVYSGKFTVSQAYQTVPIDLRRNGAGVYYVVLGDASGAKLKTSEVLIIR